MVMMGLVTALCVNLVAASVFLFVPGASDPCTDHSDLAVTTPRTMVALSGSCVLIPCNFTNTTSQVFDNRRETFGIWKKTVLNGPNEEVVFNSSGTVQVYPMEITGNLKEKTCTTVFSKLTTTYSGIYYFRIMNWPYRATAICDPLSITVKDSPPSLTMSASVDVNDLKEYESVTVTCSAPTPCPRSPPRLTWSLQKDARSLTVKNSDRTLTTKIQMTITVSHDDDGKNIRCSASYPVDGGLVKTSEAEMMLSVAYAPKETWASITPSALVSAGSTVNMTCSSRANPPISNYSWFKISKHGDIRVFEGHFYSFNVTDAGVYFCVAENKVGNQTSQKIHLTIGGSDHWMLITGGVVGIIGLICSAVSVLFLVCWRHFKNKRSTVHQGEIQMEENGENLYYGEITFSQPEPEPSSDSVADRRKQVDTLYSEVKVSQPANSSTQAAGGADELYAQVKKT